MALLTQTGKIVRRRPVTAVTAVTAVQTRPDLVRPLEQVKREHIESALILCGGNQKIAAQRLGVARESVNRWVGMFRAEDADFLREQSARR